MKTADHHCICVEIHSEKSTVVTYYLDKDFGQDAEGAMRRMRELSDQGKRVWMEPFYGPMKLISHGKMLLVEKPEASP
jgi:hypothetical protein